jgi:hypothetical protein
VSAPQVADEDVVFTVPPQRGSLNRPWRALVAVGELVVAALVLWAAYWCWPRGVADVVQTTQDGRRVVTTQYYGGWISLAVVLGTICAVLVVDAVRQLVLAVRTRPKRAHKHEAHS